MTHRLYTFVANLYLSDKQIGIQSLHACSELYRTHFSPGEILTKKCQALWDWTIGGKTVIICSAINSRGVKDAYEKLVTFGNTFDLPVSVFAEDDDSLCGAVTACSIVVPEKFYDVKRNTGTLDLVGLSYLPEVYQSVTDPNVLYTSGSPEFEFIDFLKSFRLA